MADSADMDDKTDSGHYVHPSAIVDDGAQIGSGTKIWHFVHVLKGAIIGDNCVLGQNCFVAGELGRGVKVQNNVSVYKGVTIEDEVFVGPSCVFTNVTNPRAFVERKDEFSATRVCRGASIGANATIVCGVTIGAYAFVGAGAVVREDVLPFAIVVGVPARPLGWMCVCGERLVVSDDASTCKSCERNYRLYPEGLVAL